jgi:hypothetical protein
MKLMKYALLALLTAFVATSCKSEAGKFNASSGSTYDFAPYSAASAWQQAHKVLGEKATVLTDDSANLTLVVQYFDVPVVVTFDPLTPRSCRYKVTAYEKGFPAESSVKTVYRELDRLFAEED